MTNFNKAPTVEFNPNDTLGLRPLNSVSKTNSLLGFVRSSLLTALFVTNPMSSEINQRANAAEDRSSLNEERTVPNLPARPQSIPKFDKRKFRENQRIINQAMKDAKAFQKSMGLDPNKNPCPSKPAPKHSILSIDLKNKTAWDCSKKGPSAKIGDVKLNGQPQKGEHITDSVQNQFIECELNGQPVIGKSLKALRIKTSQGEFFISNGGKTFNGNSCENKSDLIVVPNLYKTSHIKEVNIQN